jgi:thioesterase domain-containing protein
MTRPYVAPRTPLEDFLAGLWREVLRLERVGVEDHFFELGGNSILAAMLINRLQERLGKRVFVIALFDSPTIAGLVEHLREVCPDAVRTHFGEEPLSSGVSPSASASTRHRTRSSAKLIVPLQPEGSESPWFLAHPPGGILVCYQQLGHWIGRRPVYGIRSRGLQGEKGLPRTMEEMAEEYVTSIREVQPNGPYVLGGWSAGGLVALELAQQLMDQGESIRLLTLLDTTPPAIPGKPTEADRSGLEYGLDLTLEELSKLGPDEQLPYLWQHAVQLGLIEPNVPLQVAHQVLDDLKRLFRLHMSLANDNVARLYPGRVTLIRPTDAPFALAAPRDRGWGRLAAGVDVHLVPSQHHSMVKEPHVQVVATTLASCLRRAEDER